MRNVKIIDDAISKGYQDWIEDVMSGTDFPWYFNGKGITSETNPGDLATGFFHHILKDGVSSNHFQMLIPLFALCYMPWFTKHGITIGLVVGCLVIFLTDQIGQATMGNILPWNKWPLTIHSSFWGVFFNFLSANG